MGANEIGMATWNESPGRIAGPKMKFEDLTPARAQSASSAPIAIAIAFAVALVCTTITQAQGPPPPSLPDARLNWVFPAGGKQGTTVEVTVSGFDLGDARQLHFDNPGITSEQ